MPEQTGEGKKLKQGVDTVVLLASWAELSGAPAAVCYLFGRIH